MRSLGLIETFASKASSHGFHVFAALAATPAASIRSWPPSSRAISLFGSTVSLSVGGRSTARKACGISFARTDVRQKCLAGFVESLCNSADAEGLLTAPAEELKVGRQARLTTGPFADYIGTLVRLTDQGRVTLLLKVLGREVITMVPRGSILPAY